MVGNYIPLEAERKKKWHAPFPALLRTSAKTSKQLKAQSKPLFYCKKGRRKSGGYHHHSLTTDACFETFIALDELTSPVLMPASPGTISHFVCGIELLIGFKKMSGQSARSSKKEIVISCIR